MIRVWQEELGKGKTEWRGQVRHVLSGETFYFRDWQSLVEFLIERIMAVHDENPHKGQ